MAHPSADLYGSDRVLLETISALVRDAWNVTVTLPDSGPLVQAIEARGATVAMCDTLVIRKSLLTVAQMPRVLRTLWTGWLVGAPRSLRGPIRGDREHRYCPALAAPESRCREALRQPRARGRGKCVEHDETFACAAPAGGHGDHGQQHFQQGRPRPVDSSPRVEDGTGAKRCAWTRRRTHPARHDLDGAVRLVYVGRLSERKGVDVAVRSLAELRRRGVEAELVVVGAVYPGYEWFEESLRRLIDDLDAAAHVSLVGFQVDVWPLVADADIVLVPSRVDEPFGNTAVEATLAGRPCVVSDIGGLREAAGQHTSAVLVPPGREDAVADAVQSIMGDWTSYRRRALEEAAVADVKHGIQPYSDRVLAVIDRAARTNRRARRRRRRASR